jgi:hypothetical protein
MQENPLTNDDYRKINTGLGHIVQTREVLMKAQRAMLDMDEPLAVLDALQYQLETVKREFFPDRT